MRRVAVACFVVVLLVGGFAIAKQLLSDRPSVTAVPTPPPIRIAAPITLEPGQRACQDRVAFSPETRVVRMFSASPVPDVPRMRVTASAPGWSAEALSPASGPGSGSDGLFDTTLEPPPHAVLATVCVSSAEDRALMLSGSEEEGVRSRSTTTVDGERADARLGIILLEGPQRSALSHAREVLSRAAAFGPPVLGWFSVGLVLVVVALAVPVAALYATLRGLRDEGAATGRPGPSAARSARAIGAPPAHGVQDVAVSGETVEQDGER